MPKVLLSKIFEHRQVDPKWYAFWESIGAFRAMPESDRPPFSMVLPPPNVTGQLHIGHALNQTLPDIIARWRRMHGDDVLWLPGTDHAGIATQNVVEGQLAMEGKSRHDLGREAFEERVWDWARKSKETIIAQMRTLGSSVDWSRERFTLDQNLSRAVRRVFVALYKEGLIYRGKYIVNWCSRCRTALSDLEVVHRNTTGKLYYIQYRYVGRDGAVTVATTRPETMLGDVAVAVHPDDERYRSEVGSCLRLPLLDRELPIIADAVVDQEFGTGAVKVTPAHDHNDFAIGQRHDLPQVSVINEDGRMTDTTGPFTGLKVLEARGAVLDSLEREGALIEVKDHEHAVGHCQRCSTVVEPLVSTQWFVRIGPLAKPAIDVVREGKITFVPENWTKTYFEWMSNIHDWCISRQLWWGHRIPAWYCNSCDQIVVAEEAPGMCECGGSLQQDTDVLDTWFSSGLWPFSTMGWPDRTVDLERYYPTTLMLTGLDIIFFWVARMIMFGLKFGQEVPFKTVYITSLVRDAHGQKMSKSKGNVVNPLELMDEIGADALRFTLTALASPSMDISLSEGRLRGSRQFINKLWNASRFVLMQVQEGEVRSNPPARPSKLVHRWILHRVSELSAEVGEALETFRFDVAADRLYHFFWHEYADWYIELVKPSLQETGPEREIAISVLLEVHDRTLRLFHPIIPFITEEVWQQLPQRPGDGRSHDSQHQTLTLAAFPGPEAKWKDDAAAAEMTLIQEVITAIRIVRAEWGVPPARKIKVFIEGADKLSQRILDACQDHLVRLAGLEEVKFQDRVERHPETVVRVVRDLQVHVPLSGIVNRQDEANRVAKELLKVEKQHTADQSKLANPKFRERAAPEVVADTAARVQGLIKQREKLKRLLEELSR
tara:strand:- start:2786 stop:5452 length:2667 start_codon:yes stop_codon:yes gene_type:complete